jgi:DNA-binding response OmpR family regulator
MAATPILFVDDDSDICASMYDVLTDQGYGVDVTPDGPAALALIRQTPYQLALLDYRMPGMTGIELYRRLLQVRPGMVGVLVTACTADELLGEALEAGVRQIVPKPVDFRVLLPMIENILGKPEV